MMPFPLGDPLLRTRLGNFPQIFGSMHLKKIASQYYGADFI